MSTLHTSVPVRAAAVDTPSLGLRRRTNRNWVALWFMLPAAAFLILFLAYPLGLGVWLSFTDTRIGGSGHFIRAENYEWLIGSVGEWIDWLRGKAHETPGDSVFLLAVFNTLLYTGVASIIKFAVGL